MVVAAEPAASVRQVSYIATLMAGREVPDELAAAVAGELSMRQASAVIDRLRSLPRATRPDAVTSPGVYASGGQVYVVKWNRDKSHLYAMRVVEAAGERSMENGERERLELEYAPGAVAMLKAGERMSLEDGKALTARYGICICCGRHLKAAQSVEQGIGPVCRKFYA